MSSDAVLEYLRRRAELVQQTKQVESLVTMVQTIARSLSDWRHVVISNMPGGYPAELVLGHHISIPTEGWPTLEQLHRELTKWHELKRLTTTAWNRLPPDMKEGLQPPPQ